MRRLISSTLLFSIFAFNAASTDFEDVLNVITDNNLALKYSETDNCATIESMKAENSLEAPELGFESLWGANGIGDKRSFSISQGFDWPGVYSARRDAIRKSELAMQFLHESARVNTRMEIRQLLIDIIYAKQRITTTESICSGLKSMASSFKKAVEEGNETRLDYNKSVIELISAEKELKSLKGEFAVMCSSLRAFNGGRDVSGLIDKLGNDYPVVDLARLKPDVESIRLKDPALAASQAELEAQKSLVKLEKRMLLPGFSIGYSHEWEMGDRFNGFSLSVTLPFITRRKNVKAADMKAQAAGLQQEMELIKLSSEMAGDYENALQLKSLLDQYADVFNDESNFLLLKKAFDGGQINFLTYMQELNFFLSARRDFLEAKYNYNQALAKLQKYE